MAFGDEILKRSCGCWLERGVAKDCGDVERRERMENLRTQKIRKVFGASFSWSRRGRTGPGDAFGVVMFGGELC